MRLLRRPVGPTYFVVAMTLLSTLARVWAQDLDVVSLSTTTAPAAAGSSYLPRLSGEGRYVAFESNAALTSDDTDDNRDIYLFDRKKRTLTRIAPDARGPRANAGAAFDESGRVLAFHSYPPSAVLNLSTRTADIYLYSTLSGRSRLLTRGTGEPNDGEALYPSLSADGRAVVFTANATTLVSGVSRPIRQVYLFHRPAGRLEVLSRSPDGSVANRACGEAKISANGRFVLFLSAATNLLPGTAPDSLSQRLYLLDRWRKTLRRIDDPENGFDPGRWIAGSSACDARGDVIVFEARLRPAENEVPSLEASDLFLFDREEGRVHQMTEGIFLNKSHSPAVSGDGRYVAFAYRGHEEELAGLILYDRREKVWKRAVAGACSNPSFSLDGKFVAFESGEPGLLPGAPPDIRNIYVIRNPFRAEN